MSHRIRTPAIVLRRWPYSENSLVVRLLTPQHGTVSLLAKGVNKLKSGSFGVLDIWSLIQVDFGGPPEAEIRNLYRCELLDRFSGLSESADHLAAAALLAELAEMGSPTNLDSTPLFLHLVESLQRLSEQQDASARDALLIADILKSLDLLGLHPTLEHDPPHTPKQTLWFHSASGGLLPPQASRPDGHAFRLTRPQLSLLQGKSTSETLPEDAFACLTIVGDFLAYHLDRAPKSWASLAQRRHIVLQP